MANFNTEELIDNIRHVLSIQDETGNCSKVLKRPNR